MSIQSISVNANSRALTQDSIIIDLVIDGECHSGSATDIFVTYANNTGAAMWARASRTYPIFQLNDRHSPNISYPLSISIRLFA